MPLHDYVAWIRHEALPLWRGVGLDADAMLFREKLHLDGTPDRAAELRLRTQMRQVYVYAHAALLGLDDAAACVPLVSAVLHRLRALAWAPDGRPGWVHRLRPDGSVADATRDLYDHAFVLHALAWAEKATGERMFGQWADETIAFMDTELQAPAGGWAESDRRELPRRQNPHMHLFEAFLALFEAGGDVRHLARAAEMFTLFRTRFLDDDAGVLREYFGPRWEIDPALGADRIEPGHMMEWVWLLRRYARSSGRPVDGPCAMLFDSARRLGLGPDGIFLVDETDLSGTAPVARRRLWPQTEYLKALIVQSAATGDAGLMEEAVRLADALRGTYLAGTVPGGWRDQFDLQGRLTADHIPASTLYHLFAPVVEIACAST